MLAPVCLSTWASRLQLATARAILAHFLDAVATTSDVITVPLTVTFYHPRPRISLVYLVPRKRLTVALLYCATVSLFFSEALILIFAFGFKKGKKGDFFCTVDQISRLVYLV